MAIVSIVGVILLVSRLIIPELVDTIFKLSNNIPEYVKRDTSPIREKHQ